MNGKINSILEIRNVLLMMVFIISTLIILRICDWGIEKSVIAVSVHSVIFGGGVALLLSRRTLFYGKMFVGVYVFASIARTLYTNFSANGRIDEFYASRITVTIAVVIATAIILVARNKIRRGAQSSVNEVGLFNALSLEFDHHNIYAVAIEDVKKFKFNVNMKDFIFSKFLPVADFRDFEFFVLPRGMPVWVVHTFFRRYLIDTASQMEINGDWRVGRVNKEVFSVNSFGTMFSTLDMHGSNIQMLHAVLYCKHSGLTAFYTSDIEVIERLMSEMVD